MTNESAQSQLPQPDPALKRLDKLIGSWALKGHLVNSDKDNIVGTATFKWLAGGFFLQQDVKIDFMSMIKIDSHELIGYDAETKAFASSVYSNLSPVPLPYKWDVRDNVITISVKYGALDAVFSGKFSDDGNSFSGGWRPNPGADEAVNVAYKLTVTRI